MPFNWTFFKIDHYCGGFGFKMRKVGLILVKLSFDKDFKEWSTFSPVSLPGVRALSTLPFQGGVILRIFVPDSAFGTYAMLTTIVSLPLRLFLVNEIYTNSYTGPRPQRNYIISPFTDL